MPSHGPRRKPGNVPEKQPVGKAYAKTLHLDKVLMPKIAAGQVTVTGTATVVAANFNAITSALATLGAADAATGETVTATWSGTTVTFSVWTSTFGASTTPIAVSYAIFGT
jgi:hypothetical protein